jgi:hypothetical protein
MVQVRLWSGDTDTVAVDGCALESVRTKHRELWHDLWVVELAQAAPNYGWCQETIKFDFDKEDNALAFHAALLTQLA